MAPTPPATAPDSKQTPAGKDTVRKGQKNFAASTQRFLPIAEIRDDTVLLKNGGFRAVVKVNAVNFNLKSEVEQQGIISGYQSFVNTLLFPIQIIVRSSRLNIDPYIKKLRDQADKHTSELLKSQTLDYADFMEKLVSAADIMQKGFYIVVPVDSQAKTQRGLLTRFVDWLNVDDTKAKAMQRHHDFESNGKVLRDRVTLIQSGLENISITIRRLTTAELVQLFYAIYNPDTSQKEKFGDLQNLKLEKTTII